MTPTQTGAGAALLLVTGLALWSFTGPDEKKESVAPPVTLPEQGVQQRASPAPVVATKGGDAYIGRWEGLDGRFMLIEKNVEAEPAPYTVTMRYDLDQPEQSFPAEMEGPSVFVQRNGGRYEFVPSDGRASSDTRLRDRTDCLSTNRGEAYCRG